MEQQASNSSNGEGRRIRYVLRSRAVPADTHVRYLDACMSRLKEGNTPDAKRYCTYTPEERAVMARPLSTKALEFYNEKWGKNYELVDPGNASSHLIRRGCVHHMNFKAKNKDESDASVEMFFAELLSTGYKKMSVEFCVNMGPIDPPPEECLLHGCIKCYPYTIHHPAIKGFRTGREVHKAATATP